VAPLRRGRLVASFETQDGPHVPRSPVRCSAAVLAAIFTLLVSACGPGTGSPASAAVVNGEDIAVTALRQRFDSASASPELAERLSADEDGTFQRDVQAQILTQLIRSTLIAQGARTLGVEVGEADVDARRDELIEEFGGQDAFDEVVERNNLTESDVRDQIRDLVYQERVEEELTAGLDVPDDEIRAFYEENRDARYVQARARHILVDTAAEAEQVLARLEAGEDFAAVAEEVSTDEGSAAAGGELQPFGPGRMVPEFEDAVFGAEEGEVVGPVESQFGFHVIEVLEHVEETLADVRDDIRDEILEGQRVAAVQEWLAARVEEAEITVNPRFGAWDASRGEVVVADPLGEVDTGEVESDDPADLELQPSG
jgi:parvulin-like peptidyl-prolyl isomerase